MNIKCLVSAGYDLWGAGGEETVAVAVCDPEIDTFPVGEKHIHGEELKVSPDASYMSPNMRVFPGPSNL